MNKSLNAIFLSNKIVKLSWLKNISTNVPNIVVYLCTIHLVAKRKYQHKCILQQLAISSKTLSQQVSRLHGEAKHSHKSQNQHPLEGSTQRKQNGRNKTCNQRQRLLPALPENEKILTGRRLVTVPKRPSGMNMSVPSRLVFRQLRGSCARKGGKILGFSRGIRALLTWTRPNVRNERALEQSRLRPDALQTQFVPLDDAKLDPPPSMANSAAAPVPRPHHRIVLSSTC
jgi:hypothetical protein